MVCLCVESIWNSSYEMWVIMIFLVVGMLGVKGLLIKLFWDYLEFQTHKTNLTPPNSWNPLSSKFYLHYLSPTQTYIKGTLELQEGYEFTKESNSNSWWIIPKEWFLSLLGFIPQEVPPKDEFLNLPRLGFQSIHRSTLKTKLLLNCDEI